METKRLKTKWLKPNTGQIEGLPKNPRKWVKADVERLAASITETPMELEARPMIVYKVTKTNYVVLGGNMRLEAVKQLGMEEIPCFVFEGLSVDKMKEIVLKDNANFGDWDTDELANSSWSDMDLEAWGVRNIAGVDVSPEMDFSDKNSEIDTDAWGDDMTMKFKLHPEEYSFVVGQLAGKDARVEILKLVGYGE